MGLLDVVVRKYKDVTGQTKAEETDKLLGEWSLVMHEYAEKLTKLGDLYASMSGKMQELLPKMDELTLRVEDLVASHNRISAAFWLAVASSALSLFTLVYVLLK